MHRALATPDVLAAIVVHCAESKDALAALARTCHLISDYALDELWHTIDSVILLARCMPPRYWDEIRMPLPSAYDWDSPKAASELVRPTSCSPRRCADPNMWQRLTRCTRKGDWLGARFRRYASRIRDLNTASWIAKDVDYPTWKPVIPKAARNEFSEIDFSVYDLITTSVHPEVLRAWVAYSVNASPLFPNLRRLRWAIGCTDDRYLDLCPLFLRPTLTALRFPLLPSYVPCQKLLGELIRVAHARCPLLDSIDLLASHGAYRNFHSPRPADFYADEHVTRTICFEGLQSFRCGFKLPEAFTRCLISLPKLRCFDVVLSPDLTFRTLSHFLPAVRELRVAGTTPAQISELLSLVESDCIRVLHITLSDSEECGLAEVSAVLQIMACHPSAQALRDLKLVRGLWAPGRSEQNLLMKDLAPVLDLPRLRLVILKGFLIDDPEHLVDGMLHAWPELEELDIAPARARMPLPAFLAAARTHPRLRDVSEAIEITHDGSAIPRADAFVHYALRSIYVMLVFPLDSYVSAHVLCSTFPGLRAISGSYQFFLLPAGLRAHVANGTPWTEDQFRLYDERLKAFFADRLSSAETATPPTAPARIVWPLALGMMLVDILTGLCRSVKMGCCT
jgi:hypothetical protein